MKKTVLVLAAAGLVSLTACHKEQPTTENAANAQEANLTDQAAALDNQANADTSNAAAAAINDSTATYNNSVDSIRGEAEAAKNTH